MNEKNTYVPPDIWEWNKPSGGAFESINKPTAGASFDQELPKGKHPLQLYSQGTPNGVKITLMLEELLALGHKGAEYDAWLCRINRGEQFSSGFVEINPNSKIPALLDQSDGKEQRVFESGAILLYLAEKFSEFLKADLTIYFLTTETMVKTKVCIAEIKKALAMPISIIKAKVP